MNDTPRKTRQGRGRVLAQHLIALAAISFLLASSSSASAATISPNTTADEYNTGAGCSLREAIQSANADADFGGCVASGTFGADTIPLAAGTYVQTIPGTLEDANATGDLDVAGPLSIIHSGSAQAVIDGGGLDRVLQIPSGVGPVEISGVTIRGGNFGSGGGISSAGTLTLSNSTVSGNHATGGGGGVRNGGTANLTNVTISGNTTNGAGGGVRNQFGGTATLDSVTVIGNTADLGGADFGDGGGIENFSGAVNLTNTIVADNTDASGMTGSVAPDCSGGLTSQGFNLIGNTSNCGFAAITGDKTNVAPNLGPLADNGGPTQTHGLAGTSPAVDSGLTTLATDQRGLPRPADFLAIPNPAGGNGADIGAFELQLASNQFSFGKLKRNKRKGTATLVVNVPGPGELTLGGKDVKPIATPAAAAGAVKLKITPKGKAKKKLKRKGQAEVQVAVTYAPTGGNSNTQSKPIKLKKRK